MKRDGHSNLPERDRRIQEAIRATGDVCADPSFRERLKREFAEGTISEPAVSHAEPRPRRMPRWSWFAIPVAAAATALLFVLLLPGPAPTWELLAAHGEGQVEIDGQPLAMDESALVAQALGKGARVHVLEGVSLDLRLDDRLVLGLDEGADVTLPDLTERDAAGPLVSEVHHGELRIKTGPGFPGNEMHILTTEGRTEIVGTVISVQKGDGYTCICVLEGTARVGEDEDRLEDVPEGMLKIMFDDGSESILTDIASSHEADLLKFDERYRDVFSQDD